MKKDLFCYCAFCKNPRMIYRKRGASLLNYGQALGIALAVSFLFWQSLNAKALIVFALVMIAMEIGTTMRARFEACCPHCGFDPVLYVRSKEAACEKAKRFIQERQNDPDVWLARKPPLRFKKRKGSRSEIVI